MFGYIKPDKSELKVKEFELYQSVYCGLCRVMGNKYSYLYKMSLSYDFVFMVLLRLYACPEAVSFSKKRCIAHPAKKKLMMDSSNALELAADVGVIMLYHNFADKIKDRDGLKSILCRLTMPELKRLRKKACRNEKIAEFDRLTEEKLKALSSLEEANPPSIDSPAEEFGVVLGEALSLGLEDNIKKTLYEIGRNMGKWIYVIDALDDIDKDAEKGRYNPFLAAFGTPDETKKHYGLINTSMLNMLSNAHLALELLDNTDKGAYNILSNVIREGAIKTQTQILEKNNFKEN